MLKKLIACLCLLWLGCGTEPQPKPSPPDSGVDISNIDFSDLTKPIIYCALIDRRSCGTYCIPRENSTCCLFPGHDGGMPYATWYPVDNALCMDPLDGDDLH